jgi:hypothetical protein
VEEPRCPRCAALVRPEAPWCTLCYADLRPAPEPEPEPEHAPELSVPEAVLAPTVLAAPESVLAEEPALAAAGPRGRHSKVTVGEVRPVTEGETTPAEVDALAAQMLAVLAAESKPALGRFSGEMDSTGVKVGVMVGGVLLVTAILFAAISVVGLFL